MKVLNVLLAMRRRLSPIGLGQAILQQLVVRGDIGKELANIDRAKAA